VLSSALGGVVVDRLGYRRASVAADLASGVSVLGVPILYHTVGLPLAALLALVFAGSLLDAPGQTAREAMLPDLLEQAEMTLERGTSLFDGVSRAANMLGAPLAGVLIAVVGATNVLVLDAATFAVSALLIWVCVPGQARRHVADEAEGYFSQLREGYRFLWQTPLVRAIVIMVLVTNTLDAGMGGVLMPVYASQVLGSVVALGLMAGAMGLTAFAGTLVFAWIGHRAPRVATLVTGFTLGGPVRFFLLAAMPGIGPAVVGFAIAGIGIGPVNPILGTLGYERVPHELRARVFGALSAGVMAGAPLGALLAAACVELGGLQGTLIGFGVVYLICTLSPLVVPAWHDADERPVPAT
jgi:MFS family permease